MSQTFIQWLGWVIDHWADVLSGIAWIVAISSAIVKWTPTPKDDTILALVIKILKFLSLYKEETETSK
jgi:Co/Zn/Cd efflux system component